MPRHHVTLDPSYIDMKPFMALQVMALVFHNFLIVTTALRFALERRWAGPFFAGVHVRNG